MTTIELALYSIMAGIAAAVYHCVQDRMKMHAEKR